MGEAFVTVTQLCWASLENEACVARATLRCKTFRKRLRMSTPGRALCEIRFLLLTRSWDGVELARLI